MALRSDRACGRARSSGLCKFAASWGSVGKTFLANALGHLACQHGYSVRFLSADTMLRRLR
ncbi:ATP-binding protein [Sorangium sp. So ce426]|uniref:ATP-binding protein n=1 Tax=unclassified Sorangium TaxID=2621164 RepID=UPI003F5C5811